MLERICIRVTLLSREVRRKGPPPKKKGKKERQDVKKKGWHYFRVSKATKHEGPPLFRKRKTTPKKKKKKMTVTIDAAEPPPTSSSNTTNDKSLDSALEALDAANEEIEETLVLPKQQQQQQQQQQTTSFDLIAKVLAKFRNEEKKTTTRKGAKWTAKDVALDFSRRWMKEHGSCGKEYEKECFLADVALICNDFWLRNGLQLEFPLFADAAATEDGDDIFSWKCAKISLNNVKAFITVVMNWPKGKKTSGQNLIEDLKRIRARGLMKKGGKKPLRTYEQCVRQIAWAVREASEGVIEEARKMKGVSGKEKKEGLDEARVFEQELRSYVEQSWMENGLPTLPERWYEKRGGELSEEEDVVMEATPIGKRAREEEESKVPKSTGKKQKTKTLTPVAATAATTPSLGVKVEEEATERATTTTKVEYERETSLMKKIYDADEIDDDALLKRLPEPMRMPNEMDRLIAVTLRVRCHGLDADVALIPPNPPTNGFKTSAEMAELLADAAIGPESSTIPAEDNINETCPTEPWIPGRGNRCLRNDGKLWRCSFKACDEDDLFCKRHADVAFGKNLSSQELEKEANKQRDKTVAKYQGLPATVVVLSVGKVPVNIDAPGGARLCDPEIFEEHAFRAHCGVANAGGKFVPRKKITDLDANADEGDIKKEDVDQKKKEDDVNINKENMGNEFFRANARVREREGAWTNFRVYEHKLLSNIPAMTPGASIVTQESQMANILQFVKYTNEKRKVAILEALKTNNTRDKSDPTILSVVGGKTPKKMQQMLDVNASTPSLGKEDENIDNETEEKKPSDSAITKESTPPPPKETIQTQQQVGAQGSRRKDAELVKLYNESVVTRDSIIAAKIARDAAQKESGINSEDCQMLAAQIQSLEDSAMSLAKKLVMRISTLGLNISLSDLEAYCTKEEVAIASAPMASPPQANSHSPHPMESPKPSVALSIINSIKGEGQELDEALENLRECCASLTEVSRTTKAMQQSAIDHVSNSRRRCEEEREAKEEKGEENKGAQEPSYYANYGTSIEHALVCAAEMTRYTN